MATCKYCGTNLMFVGQHKEHVYFSCEFCDLVFSEEEISEDRKRINPVPAYYDQNYMQPTKILLKKNTIELFHMLRDCRKDWFNIYTLLKNLVNIDPNEIPDKEELDQAYRPLYKEFITLTKYKFVIENIILERAGFIPEKITEEFLSDLIVQGSTFAEKPMYIYIKKERVVQ